MPALEPTSRRNQAGFTLVELLVAMTLLALLSIALFGGLRFGARSWDAVIDSSDARENIARTQIFLRQRLGQLTLPGNVRIRQTDQEGRFIGEPDRVEFIAPWLSDLALGGLYRFTLHHDDAETGDLMLSWQPTGAEPETLKDLGDLAGERVLLGGIAEFGLTYYGAQTDDAEPEWHDQWDSPASVPQLVRIDLVFEDPRRVWPVFIAAPKT